jgi:hypothetical protein
VSRGDELIELLSETEPGPAADAAADELLTELFRGYPLERLRTLVRHPGPAAARAGAWLLSELGERAAPLADELPALLGHDLKYVRFFALDPVAVTAGAEDGAVIAQAIDLVSDPEAAVRWKAMTVVSRLTDVQLTAGRRGIGDDDLRDLLVWLEEADPTAIIARLTDDDPLVRRFGAVAAARTVSTTRSPLELAAASPDEEIASFARGEVRKLRS